MKLCKNPKVSVILPVYNGEPYLHEAVSSILDQTFRDFEFIIVDDGSTDLSWQILEDYKARDDRIVLRRNTKNLGLIKTLNIGIAMARGRYIARQDADDISMPDRLALQASYFEQHPEIGLIGTAYYRLKPDGRRLLRCPPLHDTEIRWKLLFNNIWAHPAVMFRRKLFGVGETCYRDFLHAEDYELWVRLIKRTRAATLPNPLVEIRDHENRGIRASNNEKMTQMVAEISAQEINALFLKKPLTSSEIEILQRLYHGRSLTKRDMAVAGALMTRLIDQFSKQPQIDPIVIKMVKSRLIKRLLSNMPANQWNNLIASGLFYDLCRLDCIAIFQSLTFHFPKQFMRRFQPAF